MRTLRTKQKMYSTFIKKEKKDNVENVLSCYIPFFVSNGVKGVRETRENSERQLKC